ncbi:MAG TPA: ribosome silencing factor [Trichocoleus sp.]
MSDSFQIPTVANAPSLGVAVDKVAPENDSALQLAYAIAQAADDRKGGDIVILQVGDVSYLADYFVIVTGFSSVQVRAIARTIEEEIEENWHRRPLRSEGQLEGSWIVQDFGEVIVHIFLPREREFYNLEAFWGHAQQIDYVPPEISSGS